MEAILNDFAQADRQIKEISNDNGGIEQWSKSRGASSVMFISLPVARPSTLRKKRLDHSMGACHASQPVEPYSSLKALYCSLIALENALEMKYTFESI